MTTIALVALVAWCLFLAGRWLVQQLRRDEGELRELIRRENMERLTDPSVYLR
jgi:hypothetical protein